MFFNGFGPNPWRNRQYIMNLQNVKEKQGHPDIIRYLRVPSP